jgi:hypothetical protein
MNIAISSDDKYTAASGLGYMNGTHALVRLSMLQRERDAAAGLNTAGFISGYRGSPLGGYDQALRTAKQHLDRHHVSFVSGVNEELAATAVWGTQQANLRPGAKYDGVFGIWYGKGQGVDRSADVFRHANRASTSRTEGCLHWRAKTTAPSPRRWRRRPTTCSRRWACRCSRRPPCRTAIPDVDAIERCAHLIRDVAALRTPAGLKTPDGEKLSRHRRHLPSPPSRSGELSRAYF